MKASKLSVRVLAVMMALLLLMGLAACGGGDEPVSSAAPSTSESSQPTEPTTDSSDVTDTTTTGNTPAETTTAGDTPAATTTKAPTVATTTTKAKPKTSLTWAQVKAKIPASAKGKTITVVDWNPTKEVKGMDAVLKKFTDETGIKVDYKMQSYGSYFSKLTANVTAQTAPDAARLQDVNRQNLINFQPINKLGYDFYDTAWDETVLDAYTFNGNIYGVNMAGSPYYSPYLMYYNTKIIEEYGFDDPYQLWKKGKWSWDDVWEMCEEFVDSGEAGSIGLSTMGEGSYIAAHGTSTITFDPKTKTFGHNLGNATFVKAYQEYAKKFEAGLIGDLSGNDAFDSGKLLFNISTGIASRTGSSYFKKLRAENAVGCVPLPALKDGNKDYQMLQEVQAFGVPKTAKNGNLVPYFLRCYFDPANYDMNGFYNVKNAKEVIDYTRKSNPAVNYSNAVITEESVGFVSYGFHLNFRNNGHTAVVKIADSYTPTLDAAVAQTNAFFATL